MRRATESEQTYFSPLLPFGQPLLSFGQPYPHVPFAAPVPFVAPFDEE
jgi:hypothetical protein